MIVKESPTSTDRQSTHTNVVTILVIVWFLLCTSVVYKYKTFIYIFWSFASCIIAALLLHSFITPSWNVGTVIGSAVCALLSGLGLFSTDEYLPYCYCIAAGYLVFDPWYYCCCFLSTQPTKSWYTVAEDVLTLTSILIALTWPHPPTRPTASMMRLVLLLWTLYKATRLVMVSRRVVGAHQSPPHHSAAAIEAVSKPSSSAPSSPTPPVWKIYGQEYDLTDFDHPGGTEALQLARGRPDATALFASYHPALASRRKAHAMLSQYARPSTHTAPQHDEDAFYHLLCARVEAELWEQHRFHLQKDRAADGPRVFYYLLVTLGVIAAAQAHCHGSVGGSFGLALVGWLWGALGHDGGHFTVSRTYPLLNDMAVWAMCFLSNPMVWQHQHTYAHHSFTNDVHQDPDLHHFNTFLRVHKTFRYYNIYHYQKHPLYVFFAYTFVVFGTCIWIPWGILREGSLYGIVQWTDRHRPWRTLGVYLHLLCYTLFIVVVPFFVHKHWYTALLAVTVHISVSGVIFAIFSQVNHLNESSMPPPNGSSNIRYVQRKPVGDEDYASSFSDNPSVLSSSWAVQQIESSNNFCPKSSLWYYLSNGLNLQIEHHLFPNINHCHLHKIQPIVQSICAEYGIQYKCYDRWYDVMHATLQWLQKLSVPDGRKAD
jgi:fatty acid desaturase